MNKQDIHLRRLVLVRVEVMILSVLLFVAIVTSTIEAVARFAVFEGD